MNPVLLAGLENLVVFPTRVHFHLYPAKSRNQGEFKFDLATSICSSGSILNSSQPGILMVELSLNVTGGLAW